MARLSVWALALALQVSLSYAQDSPTDRLQVKPPIIQPMTVPSSNATVEELERQGDRLREQKLYFDALDFYRAALTKDPDSAKLNNKAGMAELQGEHVGESIHYFQRAIKLDPKMAAAHNNLGAARYEERKYGGAVKEYKKAIKLEQDASFYSNLGAVYFSEKKWEEANDAYSRALQLDPDLFVRSSRYGISAQMSSPQDRAHFQYVLAKLYAKSGNSDRALLCLRRAMENGYKEIDAVYKDDGFANLRKDPRFAELMANRPAALPN